MADKQYITAADGTLEDPDTRGAVSNFVSNPLGAINNAVRPNSVSAQSYRGDGPIAAAASRVGSPDQVPNPNPVTTNISGEPRPKPTVAPDPGPGDNAPLNGGFSVLGGPSDATQAANDAAAPKLAAIAARDSQRQQDATQAMRQNANWAATWTDKRDAESNARIANFDARNAATDIKNGLTRTFDGRAPGADLVAAQAAGANARLAAATAAEGAARNTPISQRNLIAENIAQQEAQQRTQAAALAQKQGQQGLVAGAQGIQKGALELKHNTLIQDLATRIAGEQDPKVRTQLMSSYRTLLGKEGDRYDVKVVPGGTRFDPSNPTVPIKDPDSVVTYDRYSDEAPHIVSTGGQQQSQFKEGQVYTDAKGNKATYVNGKWVEAK